MTKMADSYQELTRSASDYTGISTPKTYDQFKYIGYEPTFSLSHARVFYVIDFTHSRYLYIDPVFQKLLGYDQETLPNAGLNYLTTLWNKNDLRIYNEKIFPETIHFLKQHPVSAYPAFSFSFNFRMKAKDGKNYTLLQRTTYFSDAENGYALDARGYIVNITNYKTDSTIIHTVEKMDEKLSSEVPLFKSVYYPDKADSVLSKRELEILSAIDEGLCSREIADRFFVSINTVNNHRKNILQKTNTNNLSELLRYAKNNGLL